MRKLVLWSGIILGGLIGLALLASVGLYSVGMQKLTRSYPNVPVTPVKIPTSPDAVARGQHVATTWGCTKCHGEDLSGMLITNDPIDGMIPLLGSIPAANLTSGKGGIAKSYSDVDWVRAIRHGVTPGGRAELFMYVSSLSDQDLGDLIAYLKQIPPVDAAYPAARYGPLVPIFPAVGFFAPSAESIDHNAPHSADPAPGATAAYGRYLSAICAGCHGDFIANSVKPWKQPDFVRAFRAGVFPDGKDFGPTMSSKTFRELNDTELAALWLYFQNPQSAAAR